MKQVERLYYKNGEVETIYSPLIVRDYTYYDLMTKGKIAKKNLLATLTRNYYETKELKAVEIDGQYIRVNY